MESYGMNRCRKGYEEMPRFAGLKSRIDRREVAAVHLGSRTSHLCKGRNPDGAPFLQQQVEVGNGAM